MTCIYDILLNFLDNDNLIDFYEWSSEDTLEHIKKIYLFKVSTNTLKDFLNYKIKVDKSFLLRIEDKTTLYKGKNTLKYACLFTDMNKVIAFEFLETGEVIAKSSLLLDEEDDIIMETTNLEEETISYQKLDKYPKETFLTRQEQFKRKYLLKEITSSYKDKNFDKILYYYEEVFEKDNKTLQEKYQLLLNDIKNNYNNKYDLLYDIVRLSYTNKR